MVVSSHARLDVVCEAQPVVRTMALGPDEASAIYASMERQMKPFRLGMEEIVRVNTLSGALLVIDSCMICRQLPGMTWPEMATLAEVAKKIGFDKYEGLTIAAIVARVTDDNSSAVIDHFARAFTAMNAKGNVPVQQLIGIRMPHSGKLAMEEQAMQSTLLLDEAIALMESSGSTARQRDLLKRSSAAQKRVQQVTPSKQQLRTQSVP
jgi:hypothetical protein